MAYIPPAHDAAGFALETGYVPPGHDAAHFTFDASSNVISTTLPSVTAAMGASFVAASSVADISTTLPSVTAAMGASFATRYWGGWSEHFVAPGYASRISGVDNEVYTVPPTVLVNDFGPTLSAIGYKTGKHYAEVRAVYVAATSYTGLRVGFALREETLQNNRYPGQSAVSWALAPNGQKVHNAAGSSGGIDYSSLVVDLIFRIAIDHDAGKAWIGVNGSWAGGGDPATGTNPTFDDPDIIGELLHVEIGWMHVNRVAHLRGLSSQFTYAPPAGFIPWAEDDGAGSDWDSERKVDLKVDRSSSEAIRYNLPVLVTLQEDSGNTHYDAAHIYEDLAHLVRRFAILDSNLNTCPTTLINVVSESVVRRNVPSISSEWATASSDPLYAFRAVWSAYDGNKAYRWDTDYPPDTRGAVKFNVDLGAEQIVNLITIENFFDTLDNWPQEGIKTASLFGSNSRSAFTNVDYHNTDNLTLLAGFALEQREVKDIHFENQEPYRYYILRIHDNHGAVSVGFNQIRFYTHTPAKFEFVTILPEVSATVDQPFFLHWNTARYEDDSNIVVDYDFTLPVNTETAVLFPDGGNRRAALVNALPQVTASIAGRNYIEGEAPPYILGTLPAVQAEATASYLAPPVAHISGKLPRVAAAASARSGNHLKATATYVTATGMSATSVLYFEPIHGSISAALQPVGASMRTGTQVQAVAPAVTASMSALTKTVGDIAASVHPVKASMRTGIGLVASLRASHAALTATNGCPATVSAEVPGVVAAMTAHEIAVRHGSITASIIAVQARASASAARPVTVQVSVPTITFLAVASTSHLSAIAGSAQKVRCRMLAAAGGSIDVSVTLPPFSAMGTRATTSLPRQPLRHNRGATR